VVEIAYVGNKGTHLSCRAKTSIENIPLIQAQNAAGDQHNETP